MVTTSVTANTLYLMLQNRLAYLGLVVSYDDIMFITEDSNAIHTIMIII